MGKIWVGTSGFNYRDWKGNFYPDDLPQKKWLDFYSQKFNSLEINATFYGSFKLKTYNKWANSVPYGFKFAIKGPRFITHIQRLGNSQVSLKKFFNSAKGLGKKLEVVLWQLPQSFKKKDENIVRLRHFIDNGQSINGLVRQVFEFRHKSWLDEETFKLLDNENCGVVISDSSKFPLREVAVGGICYIRFHGPTSLYSSSYSHVQLKSWASKIQKWSKSADVFCYFNNDSGGHAFRNAAELAKILTS